MIADQTHAKRNSRFERVADGGGNTGVGHRHDDVGFDGMFAGEQAAERFAAFVHAAAEDDAIRTREIYMLENALLHGLFGRKVNGLDTRAGDAHHFARLDFPDVLRIEQVERAGFGSNEPGLATSRQRKPAEYERAEAARVAHGNELVL